MMGVLTPDPSQKTSTVTDATSDADFGCPDLTVFCRLDELGLVVTPWTVNNRADMERLIDWGVDGIITDYPSTLRDVMADSGWALPKAYPLVEQPQFGRGAETRAEREHTGAARWWPEPRPARASCPRTWSRSAAAARLRNSGSARCRRGWACCRT